MVLMSAWMIFGQSVERWEWRYECVEVASLVRVVRDERGYQLGSGHLRQVWEKHEKLSRTLRMADWKYIAKMHAWNSLARPALVDGVRVRLVFTVACACIEPMRPRRWSSLLTAPLTLSSHPFPCQCR